MSIREKIDSAMIKTCMQGYNNYVIVLKEQSLKELCAEVQLEIDPSTIKYDDMYYNGRHIYLGKQDKVLLVAGEVWL